MAFSGHRGSRLTVLCVAVLCCASPAAAAQNPADVEPIGTAHISVTVVDAHGAPSPNVTVTLSGVVKRKVQADDVGAVWFGDLPAGRYDVVASIDRRASSAPQVVDLDPFQTRPVNITLKPFSSRMGGMQACGGFDARSLITLAATAHHVVHVKVRSQQTLEFPVAPHGEARFARTVNLVEVRQFFRQNSQRPPLARALLIGQGGGRLDRGEYVDLFRFNNLPPLNPGDEYVLFLYTDTDGTHTIHGSEEGAFRIRNGWVEPLGDAGAAQTWTQRPATEFFAALRSLR